MHTHASRHDDKRAGAMRLFALAPWEQLERLTESLADEPCQELRQPETGLVMLRGRMGATGAPFNFGEATVTRCSVKLADGTEGHAYIMGSNAAHARRAALCDAVFQVHPAKLSSVLRDIEAFIDAARRETAAKAAATKVDFFTMVRGDD